MEQDIKLSYELDEDTQSIVQVITTTEVKREEKIIDYTGLDSKITELQGQIDGFENEKINAENVCVTSIDQAQRVKTSRCDEMDGKIAQYKESLNEIVAKKAEILKEFPHLITTLNDKIGN